MEGGVGQKTRLSETSLCDRAHLERQRGWKALWTGWTVQTFTSTVSGFRRTQQGTANACVCPALKEIHWAEGKPRCSSLALAPRTDSSTVGSQLESDEFTGFGVP